MTERFMEIDDRVFWTSICTLCHKRAPGLGKAVLSGHKTTQRKLRTGALNAQLRLLRAAPLFLNQLT